MKEIPSKTTGTSYTALEFTDGIKIELQTVVANTGQVLTQSNQTQLMQAITRIASATSFYKDTGTPNVYQLVLASGFAAIQISSYYPGLMIEFLANGVNTGTATASVAGLPATNIEDGFGNNLAGGEIQPNSITKLVFEDLPNRWILVRPAATPRVQVRFDANGSIVGSSIGVSSVTQPGTGLYDITFSTPFSNSNYFVSLGTFDSPGTGNVPANIAVLDFNLATPSSLRVTGFDPVVPELKDVSSISVQVWENN